MLKITLFGVPGVYGEDEKPIKIGRRLPRALFYYLAAEGRPVSRDHLVDYFLQDEPLEKARAILRDSLGKLRRELPDKELLQATRDSVTLDFHRITVDLLELNTLLDKINATAWKLPAAAPLTMELQRQMNQAMKIWSGRNFLPGGDVEFSQELDDWTRNIEQKVVSNMVRIIKRLAAHETLSGNTDQANNLLISLLPFAEFDDEIHQAILENYIKKDAIKEARSYFEALEQTYGEKDEYPAGIRALETRLYTLQTAEAIGLPPDWNIRQSLQVPFIGQADVLEQMERTFRAGGGILVYGEAGAGKTRLVQEFFRRQNGTSRLMLASCQPLELGMPFSPWINLLRSAIHENEWKKLGSSWASALGLLLPELNEIRREKRNHLEKTPEASRATLLEAIHQTLRMISAKRPIILFLDDVHWADESTLAIVAYLLREEFFSQGRGLLVMAARIEEQNPQLDKFLLTSYPQPVRRLELPALKLGEVAELCAQVLSSTLPFSILEQLEQDTGGNPFFLLEILARLQETYPADELAAAESLPLPASINDLVKARLANLSPQARELLLVGAVMGSSFDLTIIERAVNSSPEEIIDALEALESARLIRTIPGDHPIYAFRHEKIRESLLNELSSGRKRLLNQKCATVLESHHHAQKDVYASKIALHYEAAGDLAKAFENWKTAGKNAYRLAAPYDCVEAYRRAERLLPRAIELTAEQIYELYSAWMQLAFENDDAAELERLSEALNTLGRERSSDLLIGASYAALAESQMSHGQPETALDTLSLGMEYTARSKNQPAYMRLLLSKGVYLYMLGHIAEAQEWFIKILQDTENNANPGLNTQRANAHYQMSMAENLAGFPLNALKHAQKAFEEAEKNHSAFEKICAYSAMGMAHYLASNFADGREACLQGLTLASQAAGWRMTAYLDIYCGMNELELGLIGPAWKHAQHALELGRKYGHNEIIGLGYRILGDIHMRLENHKKALQAYEQGLTVAGEHFVYFEVLHCRGLCLFQLGQEAGYRHITQALENAENTGLGSILLLGSVHELAALAQKGEPAIFESRAEWFKQECLRRLGPQEITSRTADYFRAQMLSTNGHPLEALQLLTKLTPLYADRPYRWMEFNCLTLQAAILEQTGQDNAAICQQINKILDNLESGLEDAPILFEWQSFWEKYQSNG